MSKMNNFDTFNMSDKEISSFKQRTKQGAWKAPIQDILLMIIGIALIGLAKEETTEEFRKWLGWNEMFFYSIFRMLTSILGLITFVRYTFKWPKDMKYWFYGVGKSPKGLKPISEVAEDLTEEPPIPANPAAGNGAEDIEAIKTLRNGFLMCVPIAFGVLMLINAKGLDIPLMASYIIGSILLGVGVLFFLMYTVKFVKYSVKTRNCEPIVKQQERPASEEETRAALICFAKMFASFVPVMGGPFLIALAEKIGIPMVVAVIVGTLLLVVGLLLFFRYAIKFMQIGK